MAGLEDQINSILSNPQMMQSIMAMAGSMGTPPAPEPKPQPQPQMPFDPAAMQSMMTLLRSTQPDKKQQQLLQALGAYLSGDKMNRLQKAMQAAQIAKFASSALSSGKGGR